MFARRFLCLQEALESLQEKPKQIEGNQGHGEQACLLREHRRAGDDSGVQSRPCGQGGHRSIVSATFFFIFQNKNIASAMKEGAMTGIARYLHWPPACDQHQTWKVIYIAYWKSHYKPAMFLANAYVITVWLLCRTEARGSCHRLLRRSLARHVARQESHQEAWLGSGDCQAYGISWHILIRSSQMN